MGSGMYRRSRGRGSEDIGGAAAIPTLPSWTRMLSTSALSQLQNAFPRSSVNTLAKHLCRQHVPHAPWQTLCLVQDQYSCAIAALGCDHAQPQHDTVHGRSVAPPITQWLIRSRIIEPMVYCHQYTRAPYLPWTLDVCVRSRDHQDGCSGVSLTVTRQGPCNEASS
jgi:hypothetical protein